MFDNPSEVTEQFQRISQEIIQTKELLEREYPDTRLHCMIGKIQVYLHIIIIQLSLQSQELEEKKLNTVVDLQLASQQALDNPEDDLCKKNADLIRRGLNMLSEDITETLIDIRYEMLEIDPPA